MTKDPARIRAVLFDYGGVVADEGFAAGLRAIARRHGLDPAKVFALGLRLVYHTGYVTGRASEHDFWQALRDSTGMASPDHLLTNMVLDRFSPRPAMLDLADRLQRAGLLVAILSDQSDWLDRLDTRHRFSRHFHRIYNSYHLGRTKQDPRIFAQVAADLGLSPRSCLFIDDTSSHLGRARACGMATHHFFTPERCRRHLVALGLLPSRRQTGGGQRRGRQSAPHSS